MSIKATIVAYGFSVQYFENTTIVVYAGLRVKDMNYYMWLAWETHYLLTKINNAKYISIIESVLYWEGLKLQACSLL